MYSQINYLGCFLHFPAEYSNAIDNMITGFVKGKLNIAKKRLYLTPKEGGLGLFDIPTFLHAQRCAWVKRSTLLDEHWKVQLMLIITAISLIARLVTPTSKPTQSCLPLVIAMKQCTIALCQKMKILENLLLLITKK